MDFSSKNIFINLKSDIFTVTMQTKNDIFTVTMQTQKIKKTLSTCCRFLLPLP